MEVQPVVVKISVESYRLELEKIGKETAKQLLGQWDFNHLKYWMWTKWNSAISIFFYFWRMFVFFSTFWHNYTYFYLYSIKINALINKCLDIRNLTISSISDAPSCALKVLCLSTICCFCISVRFGGGVSRFILWCATPSFFSLAMSSTPFVFWNVPGPLASTACKANCKIKK